MAHSKRWPTRDQLRAAPELGVLALLDSALIAASTQLLAEHPQADWEAEAAPWPRLRLAARLLSAFYELRADLIQYQDVALDLRDDDQLHLPF